MNADGFDGTAIERVGSIVYSITTDETGEPVRGPWAICDHCGAVETTIAWRTTGWGTFIVVAELEPHHCPPVGAPLPANSVCARRPCNRCLIERQQLRQAV